MVLKVRAFLGDLANPGQGENLLAAAVGQDRPRPGHKRMEPAKMANHFESWPNEKVIGITKNNLRGQLSQLARTHRLHCPLGPDWHEGRGFDHATSGRQPTTP